MRILFTGGGTLGSVTPLLAIWETRVQEGSTGLWIGSRQGVERSYVERAGLPFVSIYSGKLRRYFSFRNFFDPFLLLVGLIQAGVHILRFNPDVIINAGSFVGVPVLFAGAVLGKKCIAYQLDIEPSLSNIMTSGFAECIVASCEEAASAYNKKKTHIVGIPVRFGIRKVSEYSSDYRQQIKEKYAISDGAPIILVLGGGTGATAISTLIWDALPELTKNWYVVHVTGKGKESLVPIKNSRYRPYALLGDEFGELLSCADVVVSRPGMGTLAELSCVGRAALLIPMPDSHQEKNALFAEKKGAARYCDQRKLTPALLVAEIERMLRPDDRLGYEEKMKTLFIENATEKMCDAINGLMKK